MLIKKLAQPNADNQARRIKKSGECVYGYKRHIGTDQRVMVLGVHTTTANEHDSKGLGSLIDKIPGSQRRQVMADKAYKSKSNDKLLKDKGSKSRLMHKAYRTSSQRKLNKI